MKPSKRCNLCSKPIWDHDYVSTRDPYMDHTVHVHSCCYQEDNQRTMDDMLEDARTMDIDNSAKETLADMILRLAEKQGWAE